MDFVTTDGGGVRSLSIEGGVTGWIIRKKVASSSSRIGSAKTICRVTS